MAIIGASGTADKELLAEWNKIKDAPSNNSFTTQSFVAALEANTDKINKYNTKSSWFFEKIFENPYIASTLYFYKDASVTALERGICSNPIYDINNGWSLNGASIASEFGANMLKLLKNYISLDTKFGGYDFFAKLTMGGMGLVGKLLNQMNVDVFNENKFKGWVEKNYEKLKNSVSEFSSSIILDDSSLSSKYSSFEWNMNNNISFCFLQDSAKGKSIKERVWELLKYFLPSQSSFEFDFFKGKKEPGSNSINGESTNTEVDSGSKIVDKVFDFLNNQFKNVIETRPPNEYTENLSQAARISKYFENDEMSNKTFILQTPWGLYHSLLPSRIEVVESNSKVLINNNKVVPMYIQVNVSFVPTRVRFVKDLEQTITGHYNFKKQK